MPPDLLDLELNEAALTDPESQTGIEALAGWASG